MLEGLLRTAASSLQAPVIFLLIVLAAVTVVCLGWLVAEVFTERRMFKACMPSFIDKLTHSEGNIAAVIDNSGLLNRHKVGLKQLLMREGAGEEELTALAVNVVSSEQLRLNNRVKITDTIAKIGPMVGLMGTLIPLGPGLIAISEGNTEVLAQSLLIAFDTTIMGMAIAAVALIISVIRKSWYARYMTDFEAAAECVLKHAKANAND